MSHRNNPPRQSAAQRGPKVVSSHAGAKSVGTHCSRKPPTLIDVHNKDPEAGAGPGANGPPTTGTDGDANGYC